MAIGMQYTYPHIGFAILVNGAAETASARRRRRLLEEDIARARHRRRRRARARREHEGLDRGEEGSDEEG